MSNPVQQYIAALNDNPNDAQAFAGLEAVLTEERAWTDIEHMLPKFARRAAEAGLRASYLGRAAFIARHMNGNASLADGLLSELMGLGLDGAALVVALRVPFEVRGDWRGYVGVLLDVAEVAQDDRVRSRVYHALGRAYEDKLYERERAITCYQRAFKLDPMFTEPLRAARVVYAHADQWGTVAKLYQIELKVTEDRREQARLLKELGHVEIERLGLREQGLETLKHAAELDPALSGVVAAIETMESDVEAHGVIVSPRIMQSSAAVQAVPETIPRAPVASSDEDDVEPATVQIEVGVIEVDAVPVTGMTGALEAVEEDDVPPIVEVEPEALTEEVEPDPLTEEVEPDASTDEIEPEPLTEEVVLAPVDETVVVDVAAEPFDTDDGEASDVDVQDLAADVGEPAVQSVEPGADDASLVGVATTDEAAQAADDEAADAAVEDVETALAESADDLTASEAGADEAIDEVTTDDAPPVALPEEGDDARPSGTLALAAFVPAESAAPELEAGTDAPASDAASAADGAPSDDAGLVSGASAPVAPSGASPRVQHSSSAPSMVAARPVVVAARAPREAGPDAPPIAGAADAIDAAVAAAGSGSGSWAWAMELAVRGGLGDDQIADLFCQGAERASDGYDMALSAIAPLYGRESTLAAVADSLEMYADGAADGPYAGAAYAVVFYGLGDWSRAQPFSAHVRAARADAEALDAAQKGNWRKAQLSLQEAQPARPGVDAEAESYRAQAYLALGLGKEDKAADSVRRVLRANKSDVRALELAAALYRRDAKWGPLAETLKALAGLVPGDDRFRQAVYWRDLVSLYRDDLNQPTNVMVAYKALLDVDPSDTETIDAYAALLTELNRPQDLVQVLRLKADAVSSDAERVAIHKEVAQIFLDKFSNQAEAIASYETVLRFAPEDDSVLLALEDLYGKRREWDKLIAVKRQLVALSSDMRERAARLRECADVAATRMRDQALSVSLWDEVLTIDPNDAVALEHLERLYEREKDWERFADVLARRVHGIDADEERAAALLRLGQVQYDRLGRTEDAVATYEELLSLDPENFRAKDAIKKAYIELEDWDKLESFFGRGDAWAEYVRQLEALVGTIKQPATQVDLLFRAADVWADRLGDPGRATKALERVLSIDERNHDAAVRLVPVYEERQDYKRLPALLEVVLEREEDAASRAALMVKLARIASERSRDWSAAFRWYGSALDEQATRVDVLENLEAAARATQQWRSFERHVSEARASLAGDPAQQQGWLRMSLQLGRVYDAELGDATAALVCFDEVLSVVPGDATALDAKDSIYTRLGEWDALLEVLETKLGEAVTDGERVALLARAAQIHEVERDDVSAAVRAHEEVLLLDAASVNSYEALRRLHGRSGDAEALAEVLRRLIELRGDRGETDARRQLRLELASVCVDALGANAAAVEVLRAVVAESPGDAKARTLLEGLVDDDEQRLSAAQTLEPLYEREGAWAKLVDALETQLTCEIGDDASREILSRVGDLHRDRLHQPAAAIDAYARLLQLHPFDESARARLEAVTATTGDWGGLVSLYESLMSQLNPADAASCALAVTLGERAAGVLDERVGDLDEAIRLHRRVLDVSPAREATLVALDGLYTRTEAWTELLGVIEDRLTQTSALPARRALYFQAAAVWEHKVDDAAEAIATYRRVLDLAPGDDEALTALDRLYAATGDAASRAEVIGQRVGLSEPGSAHALMLKNRLAAVYHDELGDVPQAMALWHEVLDDAPSNEEARSGLEAQLHGGDFAMEASTVLEPLYVSAGQASSLATLLEIRLQHMSAPPERLELYHRLATLHERELRAPAQAYDVLLRAAEEFLTEPSVLEGLTRLASALERFVGLCESLEALANDASDPQARRDTLALVARLREDRVGDAGAAATLWRQVLEDNPEDRQALDALERLDEQLEAWGELVDVLLRKADLSVAGGRVAQAKPLMFRASVIFEEMLEKPEEAVEVLTRVLQLDASDRHAIGELERLYTQTGRWEDLVDNYGRKLELAGSDDERRDLYFTLGAVLETELDDADRAVSAYRSALGLFPNDLEALQALDRLYVQTGNAYELQDVLRRQVELVDSDEQRRNVRYRIARLLESDLGDAAAAVREYAAVLAGDGSHRATRSALQAMITRGEEPVAAAALLEPIYRTEGLWHDLIAITRTLIDNAETAQRRRELSVEIARIMEIELSDAGGAIEAFSAAAQEETRLEELSELERLAPITGGWSQIASLFAELWDDVTDPDMQAEIGARLARIRETELDDVAGAVAAYARLHDESPLAQMPMEQLDRLYAQTAQWELLAETLQQRIDAGGPANDGVGLRLRLANVRYEFLDDAAEAVSMYRQVLDLEPHNATATERLESMIEAGVEASEVALILDPLYRDTGSWRKLVGLNGLRIHTEVSADERYRIWIDTAEAYEVHLRDQSEALNALGNALFERPGDEALKNRIEALGGTTEQWSVVADIYAMLLEQDLVDMDRLDTAMRLARVLSGPLADAERSEVAYRLALDVDPANAEALLALDEQYSEQGRWAELVSVIGRRREVVYEPAQLVALAYRQASVYRDRLGDAARAVATFNDVLDVEPGHRASIDALIDLYGGQSRWEDLFDTYERLSLQLIDESERTDVTVRMASLATEKLDRPNDGIDLWQSVLQSRPADRQALANLARLYERTEQYNDLVEVLDRQIAQEQDATTREALLRRAGSLWSDVLDNPDQAIERWVRVIELRPADAEALSALRGLYEQVGDYERLADVLEQQLLIGAIAADDEAAVYEQLGGLYADTLLRPADAVNAWREVAARRPEDEAPLDRLEELYGQQASWEPAIGVVERKVALAPTDEDRIELLKRIADLWQTRVGNQENAAAALERVLELDLGDFDATSRLETIYTETQSWAPLAALCVDRLDVVSDPWERVGLLRRAAELYEKQIGDVDAAFLIVGKAVREAPTDEMLRQEYARLADAASKHVEYVKTYDDVARGLIEAGDSEAAIALLLSNGAVCDTSLGRLDAAERYYEQVLALDGEHEGALSALEGVYERSGSWASLIGVLRRRAHLTSDVREQVACHKRIGQLFETKLDDAAEAVEAYKMAVRVDDTDVEALGALERIYEQTGQWRELVDVLSQKAESTYEPGALVVLHGRMGEIWQTRLGNLERAVSSYDEVLMHDPANVAALGALEGLYAALDRWEKFLEVLDARLSLASTREERIDIFAKQALVYEQKFDDVDGAVGAFLNILSIDGRDLEAITSLERIFADQERFAELLETFERHVHAVEAVGEKAEVLCRMALVQVEQQDDAYAALGTYRRVLQLDPSHVDALARSGALYETVEQPLEAVAAYERLAEVLPDADARIRLYFRSGQLLQDTVGDGAAARLRFERCLQLDPEHGESMAALERIHTEAGDWARALSMLQAQIDIARDLGTRSALMVRMGRIHAEELGETPRAQQLFEEAAELDPSNVDAASPLAEIYYAQQEWVRARPLFELRLRGADELSDDARGDLYLKSGVVNEQLGFDVEAVRHYEHALDSARSNLDALRGLARLYSRLGRGDAAYQTYVELLATHRASLRREEVVAAYVAAGELKLAGGDDREARHLFLNALETDPQHPTALRHLLSIVERVGTPREVVEAKQRMLPATTDELQRFKLLVDIGDTYLSLQETAAAEAAYRDAVRIDATSKVVLHKLLKIFTDTGNWRRATEVLGQLAAMEDQPEKQARLCFSIAAIFRDELGEAENAVKFFNQALDAKYDHLEAFEAIDHLLTSARDWRALEQNYRRMLERVFSDGGPDTVDLKVTLLKNLGEIYRSRLQQPDQAVEAYKAASQLAPEDAGILKILAELVGRGSGTNEDVIRLHQRLIQVESFPMDSYRALFKAYLAERRFDEAWCMASALTLLQKATPDEVKYYERYLTPNIHQAQAELTLEQWSHRVFHPELDHHVTTLMALLGVHLRPDFRRDPKDWGVNKRKDRLDPEQPMPLTKMVSYAASRVGVTEVAVYEKQDTYGLVNMNCDPPSLLAGRDMLSGKAQRYLAFQVTKAVAQLKPEFYLASAFPSTEHLKTFFLAAYAATTGQIVGDGNTQLITAYAQSIQELPPPVLVQVQRAMQGVLQAGRSPDLSAWLRSVDYTTSRVGLLLCGDLRAAVEMIRQETESGQSISKADIKDKVRELILFSVSESYFGLRRDLGLALTPAGG